MIRIIFALLFFSSNLGCTADKFPLVMNSEVRTELMRLTGTPGRRQHLRECLQRMKEFEPIIRRKLRSSKLPPELLAIPFVESGYRNIHSKNGWGSGLWMFIESTAKSHGLKVNHKVDQRLDVLKSTDAAIEYLEENYDIFEDWHLTVMSYNMGENKVLDAIKKSGSKDPWKLIRNGHERERGYLARVIAVAMIIKDPKLADD